MSALKVRAALESALNAMSPALATAWENVPFTPTVGTPYQDVFIQFNEPENPVFDEGYRENGILQINLRYPKGTGSKDAATRAELIRSTFKRGYSFSASGVTVTINRTPEIGKAAIVEDRFFLPVRIRFYANIFN